LGPVPDAATVVVVIPPAVVVVVTALAVVVADVEVVVAAGVGVAESPQAPNINIKVIHIVLKKLKAKPLRLIKIFSS
jgi:hypothetical protein